MQRAERGDPHKTMTTTPDHNAVYRKIGLRLLPFLLACYVINYLDRVSVGYAKLQFLKDMHLSDTVFGLITSAFFVGYILLEIPSNMWLLKIGAPKTLMRIMTLWGLTTVSMAWAQNETWFYIQRFLLGAFEAGFFPGILLYLSFWFPNHQRGRATSLFLVGIPLSGIVGGAISGGIMDGMDGILGMRGWRWLFLIDGIPAVLLGLAAWFVLTDRPENAKFLTQAEKDIVVADMAADRAAHKHGVAASVMDVFKNPRVWLMVFIYFSTAYLNNSNVWFPTLLQQAGAKSVTETAHLLMFIWGFVAIMVIVLCRSSDRALERKWHMLGAGLTACVCYLALPLLAGNLIGTAMLLALSVGSAYSMFMIFWTIPPVWLEGRGAAAGIALISAMGQFGGLLGPFSIGYLKDATGTIYTGFTASALLIGFGALLAAFAIPHARLRKAGEVAHAH
jgi:sugar phosphate permease